MTPDTKYTRPLKADMLKAQYSLFAEAERPGRLEIVRGGVIIPPAASPTGTGIVADCADGRWKIVPFSCQDIDSEAQTLPDYGGLPEEELTVLYAGRLNPHWGHFLVDSLSRLWPAFNGDCPDCDRIVFTCEPGVQIHSNIRKMLELTGLADKIIINDRPARYRSVIVPEFAVLPRERFLSAAANVYETIAANAQAQLRHRTEWPKKIYLSRGKFRKALRNEPCSLWVDRFFADNGFEILYPELLSPVETIGYLRNAETVAAVSGTLPHNMLFARPGCELWIIDKTPALNNYQQGIDLLKDLRVTLVDANAEIWNVDVGLGPFLLYPNSHFLDFARDKRLAPCAPWSDGQKRKALRKFFSIYRRNYSRQWRLAPWEEAEIASLREAYAETMTDFGPWIRGERPIFAADYCKPMQILKNLYHLIIK